MMAPELVVAIAIAILLLLLILELPIALALAGSGGAGIFLLAGPRAFNGALGAAPFTATSSYSLAVIPLFILMGALAVHGRIAEHVFSVGRYHLRRLPGGLGVATVVGCAGFAAVTGSSVATAATFARMSVGEMINNGYSKQFAAGIVASAGTLGVLIPPSVLLVFYGLLTGEGIGDLLIAGVIPGLLSAFVMAAYVVGNARFRGIAKGDTELSGEVRRTTLTGKGRSVLPYRGVWRVLTLFVVIMGGIYTGIFTSNEAAGIGAMIALLVLIFEHRKEGPQYMMSRVFEALRETGSTSAMIFMIMIGSSIFSYMLVLSGLPEDFVGWITHLNIPAWLIVAAILVFCIPLGMALDSISIMAITVPLTYPVIVSLGYDGIWYGILMVKMCELGLITPPVGANCFVVSGVAKVPLEEVFRGILPFVVLDLVLVTILFLVPELSLWLPAMMSN